MEINEKALAQLFLEFKEAQGQALGILTQALCQQIDPAQLKTDLQRQIAAARQVRGTSSLAIDIATQAMAAAEAEKMLQARPLSEGPHPKRG